MTSGDGRFSVILPPEASLEDAPRPGGVAWIADRSVFPEEGYEIAHYGRSGDRDAAVQLVYANVKGEGRSWKVAAASPNTVTTLRTMGLSNGLELSYFWSTKTAPRPIRSFIGFVVLADQLYLVRATNVRKARGTGFFVRLLESARVLPSSEWGLPPGERPEVQPQRPSATDLSRPVPLLR